MSFKKTGGERVRVSEGTWHPRLVGIRSKVWHVAQWDHRYSLVFNPLLFSSSDLPIPPPLLTLSWALANSVAHSPLCLFCAGVITSLKNAALCLFLRREEGHATLTEEAVFHSCSLEMYN